MSTVVDSLLRNISREFNCALSELKSDQFESIEMKPIRRTSLHTIEDLPDEVLEFILGMIPPYKDLHDCMLVSKRWRRCVLNVTKTKCRNFDKAIIDFDLCYKSITPVAMAPSISKRYSHNAVVHENSMYVFGGCTCNMTTFNDLWRLDLSKRQWVRPLTIGTYPSPKACSTMVCYKDCLVLFGGWTYPPSYPLHQSWHLFNELHLYDIKANKWSCINTLNKPPPIAGHSVSVHGANMIVFGGLQRPCSLVHSIKSNEVWTLNLNDWTWQKQNVKGDNLPLPRYGQSQIALDDENVLIMGGSGGPSLYYSDVWVLNMSGEQWTWKHVLLKNKSEGPNNLWSNPACRVGDKIVVLNKMRLGKTGKSSLAKIVWREPRRDLAELEEDNRPASRIDLAQRQVDRDENVNGRHGVLRNARRRAESLDEPSTSNRSRDKVVVHEKPSSSGLSLAAFSTEGSNSIPSAKRDRQEKRLEHLNKLHEKMKSKIAPEPKKNILRLFVLDISHILDDEPYATWMPGKDNGVFSDDSPEETVLYTLVKGKSELIMFGGIQKEDVSLASTTNLMNQVSNSLHFITAPRYII